MAQPQDLARAAYDNYLPKAQALAGEQVLEYRIDPDLAIININHGMGALADLRDSIPDHLPEITVEDLDDLPALALAAKFAALRAETARPDGATPGEMITEGWYLRRTLLPIVAGLAAAKVIPRHVHEDIVPGHGARDMAEDLVALSQVFRDHAQEVAGKHAADPAMIARAEEVGSWLLQNLSKRNAPQPAREDAAAIDIRDRMATLLVERYGQLRAVAYYFHGDAFAAHVPPLMSRQVPRRRPDDEDGEDTIEPDEPAAPAPEAAESAAAS